MRRSAWWLVVCVACGSESEGGGPGAVDPVGTAVVEEDDTLPPSACGETHIVDEQISGRVTDPAGNPVADADVWLEQRDWGALRIHGGGISDADGTFLFPATELPIIEGCWGVGPQFYAVADTGEVVGEVGANMAVVRGWQDGTGIADLHSLSFVVDRPTTP